jgi:hypothetical protein
LEEVHSELSGRAVAAVINTDKQQLIPFFAKKDFVFRNEFDFKLCN